MEHVIPPNEQQYFRAILLEILIYSPRFQSNRILMVPELHVIFANQMCPSLQRVFGN
jgi:hypothetical protein